MTSPKGNVFFCEKSEQYQTIHHIFTQNIPEILQTPQLSVLLQRQTDKNTTVKM